MTKTIKEKLQEAIELLKEFNDCPKQADEDSRTKNFDEENLQHRQQFVVNFSCSYDKVYRLNKFLNSK